MGKEEDHKRTAFFLTPQICTSIIRKYLLFFADIHVVSRYALAKNDFEQRFHCLHYLAPSPLPYWNKEQSNFTSKGVQSLFEPDFDPSMTNQKRASGSQFLTK